MKMGRDKLGIRALVSNQGHCLLCVYSVKYVCVLGTTAELGFVSCLLNVIICFQTFSLHPIGDVCQSLFGIDALIDNLFHLDVNCCVLPC